MSLLGSGAAPYFGPPLIAYGLWAIRLTASSPDRGATLVTYLAGRNPWMRVPTVDEARREGPWLLITIRLFGAFATLIGAVLLYVGIT